jgi:EamA domain-containing membrane protein RarD
MYNHKHYLLSALAMLMAFAANAQGETDVMRSNGKIYVVMVVVLVILLGLFLYVWRVDKKITRLEK